jgi:negative regulator of sigma E activity
MTQHRPAAPTPYSALRPPPAPEFGAEKRPWCGRVLPNITLVVAVAAAVMAGIALARQPSQSGDVAQQPASTSSVPAPAPSAAEIAAARKDACDAWTAASTSMVATLGLE